MNKYFLVVLLSLFMQVAKVAAAPWQWSVEIKELISEETNAHPSAYLWIPENCKQVRAVIIGKQFSSILNFGRIWANWELQRYGSLPE